MKSHIFLKSMPLLASLVCTGTTLHATKHKHMEKTFRSIYHTSRDAFSEKGNFGRWGGATDPLQDYDNVPEAGAQDPQTTSTYDPLHADECIAHTMKLDDDVVRFTPEDVEKNMLLENLSSEEEEDLEKQAEAYLEAGGTQKQSNGPVCVSRGGGNVTKLYHAIFVAPELPAEVHHVKEEEPQALQVAPAELATDLQDQEAEEASVAEQEKLVPALQSAPLVNVQKLEAQEDAMPQKTTEEKQDKAEQYAAQRSELLQGNRVHGRNDEATKAARRQQGLFDEIAREESLKNVAAQNTAALGEYKKILREHNEKQDQRLAAEKKKKKRDERTELLLVVMICVVVVNIIANFYKEIHAFFQRWYLFFFGVSEEEEKKTRRIHRIAQKLKKRKRMLLRAERIGRLLL